jgi:hypothetical protein
MTHVFQIASSFVPESREALREIATWLDKLRHPTAF